MASETSLLFPRLPKAVAQQEYASLAALPLSAVSAAWDTSHPDAVVAPIGGTEVTPADLTRLRERVLTAAETAGFPGASDDARRAAFDLELAEIVGEEMSIVPAEAVEGDLWAFIGVILLPDITFWRFDNRPVDRILGTDLTRHVFARVWWRAYQLRDLTPDSGLDALRTIPESAMNQLFERRNIGGNRSLVRAIARAFTDPDPKWQGIGDRELLRDAVKRVQRMLPFIAFEALDSSELDLLIRGLFGAAAEHLSGAASTRREKHTKPRPPSPASVEPAETEPSVIPTQEKAFAEIPLARLTVQIAELVSSLGGVPFDDLERRFTERYGVSFQNGDGDALNRLAWSASGHHYTVRDADNELWLPGTRAPQPLEEFGDWTYGAIRTRAEALLCSAPKDDPYEQVLREVCAADKPPRVVRTVVGKAVAAARRKHRPRR